MISSALRKVVPAAIRARCRTEVERRHRRGGDSHKKLVGARIANGKARVFTVINAKGGSGATSLAVNLATAVQRRASSSGNSLFQNRMTNGPSSCMSHVSQYLVHVSKSPGASAKKASRTTFRLRIAEIGRLVRGLLETTDRDETSLRCLFADCSERRRVRIGSHQCPALSFVVRT
jgi:Mrp family chromosome partitioning ATPase